MTLVWLWDFCAWALIAFPLLTGGFWFQRPGLRFELTELAVPTIIVALLAWLIQGPKHDLRKTTFVRSAAFLESKWVAALERAPAKTLFCATLAVSVISSWASIRRHQAFDSAAADFGLFINALWNLVHGFGYISSVEGGLNLFADHQSPIYWLVAPLFRLLPFPETLLVLQATALASGGIALFMIGRNFRRSGFHGDKNLRLTSELCAALPLLYWAYAPNRKMNAFDFHPETLMIPLFLFAWAGISAPRTKAKIAGFLALLAALGCKESAGPVAVGIGLALLSGAELGLDKGAARRWAGTLIMIGLGVFAVDLALVPSLVGGTYRHASLYAYLRHPELATLFHQLLGYPRLRFLVYTLGSLAFLPLFQPRAWIAAIPGYAMLFLSEGDRRLHLDFYYSIEPSIGLFLTLPGALPRAENWFRKIRARVNFSPIGAEPTQRMVPTFAVWTSFWVLAFFGRCDLWRIRFEATTPHTRWLSSELLPCLTSTSISASQAIVPHISNRHWVRALPDMGGPPDFSDAAAQSRGVDCVLFDPAVNNWGMGASDLATLEPSLQSHGYRAVYSCGEVRLWRSAEAAQRAQECLACVPHCP